MQETVPTARTPSATELPPPQGDATMFCTACGSRNQSDANFCKQCGHRIDRAATPTLSDEQFALPVSTDDRVAELLVQAFHKEESGQLDEAVAACAEALALKPESTSAHSLMGLLYDRQGERDKAIAEYEHVLLLNPGSIADREKLEQLRDGGSALTPRRITSVRRRPAALVLTPGGSAMAAVFASLVVVLLGGWWALSRAASVRAAQAPLAQPAAQTLPGPQPLVAAPPVAAARPAGPPPQGSVTFSAAPAAPPVARTQTPDVNQMTPPRRQVPPAPVLTAVPGRLEDASQVASPPDSGTIHLPDPQASQAGPPQPPTSDQPPSRPTGKIEIVVAPSPTADAGPAAPARSSGDGTGATADSRSAQSAARQLQAQGQYRRAAAQYIKSLDGAGDEAALIHQQIGLCYQRLDDRESAVAHYNDAIAAYKSQAAAGRNADAAQRGIRFCEAGLRACQ